MSSHGPSIVIVGAGVFGLTAALELRSRAWRVTVLDAGTVPRDTAASTDISKVVRMDYGDDEFYTALGEAALAGWDAWNARWNEPLYHEDGFLLLSRHSMDTSAAAREAPHGGEGETPTFERDSFALLTKRGHRLERMTPDRIEKRHPAWAGAAHVDGYFNPRAGWAESGRVVTRLAAQARSRGVDIREGVAFDRLLEDGSKTRGVVTTDGGEHRADCVLVAAGAWTPTLLPHLGDIMWATGQPVLHFQAPTLDDYVAPRFPVWASDIARTGWYGFPAHPDGRLKIANHGPGRRVHPDEPRTVTPEEEARFREFLRDFLPALAGAPIVGRRLCLYCDTADGDFWIDHDPRRDGLIVAAGDSGHAFKFAPVLGQIIADVVERRSNAYAKRFAWRNADSVGKEAARWNNSR
jgi:glycine/D-amino acid oxidase-like deaminating enzyme